MRNRRTTFAASKKQPTANEIFVNLIMYKTAATNKREAMELNVESGNEGYVPAPAHQLTKNSSIRIKENDDGSSLSRAKRRQREAMTFNIESDAEDYVPAPPHQFTQILPQQRSQQIWKRHQSSFPIKKDDDGSILPRVKERPREAMTFNMESNNEGYVPAPPHQEDDEGSIRSFAHQEERTSKPLIQRRKALQPRKVTFEEKARVTVCSSQVSFLCL